MSEDIKIKDWYGHKSIKEPSGKKITASKLETGKSYLHTNLWAVRTIIDIIDTRVLYVDQYTHGVCSKTHFASKCPYEATEAEIEFLENRKP